MLQTTYSTTSTKSNIQKFLGKIGFKHFKPASGKPEADDRAILQIDLRVNGIPSDEIYKDEQYMQNISKQMEKLVDTEKSLQEEPLESNIFSEEAEMKIYEAGNCELLDVQERSVKVQCQRRQAHVEAGFQVCQCGGKLDSFNEMLARTRRKFNELIESSHFLPFQKKRGSKHGVLPVQERHRRANEMTSKIKRRKEHTSILDRFQRHRIFRASRLVHGWTEVWCKYLDYIANIDITHQASPE